MTDSGEDLDDLGYMRHCVYPRCKAEYHTIRGATDGRPWFMGHSGPVGGAYICPDHIEVIRPHTPCWVNTESVLASVECACGWRWTPQERSPAGVYLETWKFHVRDADLQVSS